MPSESEVKRKVKQIGVGDISKERGYTTDFLYRYFTTGADGDSVLLIDRKINDVLDYLRTDEDVVSVDRTGTTDTFGVSIGIKGSNKGQPVHSIIYKIATNKL